MRCLIYGRFYHISIYFRLLNISMAFVKHKFIKENKIESRLYQEAILSTAIKNNTLVVLPTGLGKTPIAVVLAAIRLEKFPKSKILMVAPTKPLTNQHYKSFSEFMNLEDDMVIITGENKPSERKLLYEDKKIFFATPQTIRNDLDMGRLDLKDFSLLIIDEIHHSVGRYAYPFVAKKYLEEAKNPRILGLTASPGFSKEKIEEIKKNSQIEKVEIRTEDSSDVKPYVKKKKIELVKVDLPEKFLNIKKLLEKEYNKRVEQLKKMGFLKGKLVTKKHLIDLQLELVKSIKKGYKNSIIGLSVVGQAIKLEHAIGLLETQGITILDKYFQKMKKERKSKKLAANKNISNAIYLTRELREKGYKHPKIGKICSILDQQIKEKPDSKIIIFAHYRETVKEIVSSLKGIDGIDPVEFVGQKEGMTQKRQIETLNEFRLDLHNVLVATSIGEEGLDIPSMDLAIFYEPAPSEIRTIQRRGRVGRQKAGKIIILITKNTRDEAYHWVSHYKEKKMKDIMEDMKQKNLGEF